MLNRILLGKCTQIHFFTCSTQAKAMLWIQIETYMFLSSVFQTSINVQCLAISF